MFRQYIRNKNIPALTNRLQH